jgi:hypothetical protein
MLYLVSVLCALILCIGAYMSDHSDMEEPESYWMTKIVGRRLRKYDVYDDGEEFVFNFQYKTEWFDSDALTWVDEHGTGDDESGIVRAYILKNNSAIVRDVTTLTNKASNQGIPFKSKFFSIRHGKCVMASGLYGADEPLDDDDGFADDDRDVEPDDGVVHLTLVPYFSKAVNGTGEFTSTLDFNRNGVTCMSRDDIAHRYGFVSDHKLFLCSGMAFAEHDEYGHFTVPSVVLSTDATYTLTGTREIGADGDIEEKSIPCEVAWPSPILEEDKDKYAESLHACAFLYLTTGDVAPEYNKTATGRTNFVKNCRRRFKVVDGELWYNRGRRVRKSLPRKINAANSPWVLVPRMGRMWEIIEEDHREHHDGHNRAEPRLGNKYFIPGQRAFIAHAHSLCVDVCQIFDTMPKGCVTPIITTRVMQLLMFDLFFLPCPDTHGNTICILCCDHFTKYVWGAVLDSKRPEGVVDFLLSISQAEGNAERWHCDNGGEFKNVHVEVAGDAEHQVDDAWQGPAPTDTRTD